MSQISSSLYGLTKSMITDVGGPVTPTTQGAIILHGGNNITTDGTVANTVTINLTGTTNHCVQVGNASGSLTSLAAGITGQTIMGTTGADPSWTGSPSFSGTVTAGTGLTVSTGNTTLTPLAAARPGIVRSSTAGVISALIDSNTDGQVLISSSVGVPVWASLTAGSGVTITPGANTITISGFPWTQVAGNTQAAAVNNGYICQNAGLTTVTLPATAAYGSVIEVVGEGTAGFTIVHPVAGHYIQYGNLATTANTGSLSSSNRYDCVRLVCRVTDTTWQVLSAVGVLNVA
jgi:hypothetical protein